MEMITVTIKNVWGNELVYPADDLGVMMCQLMGTKTLPSWGIDILKANGYTFKTVTPASI